MLYVPLFFAAIAAWVVTIIASLDTLRWLIGIANDLDAVHTNDMLFRLGELFAIYVLSQALAAISAASGKAVKALK